MVSSVYSSSYSFLDYAEQVASSSYASDFVPASATVYEGIYEETTENYVLETQETSSELSAADYLTLIAESSANSMIAGFVEDSLSTSEDDSSLIDIYA